jgi:hypothetical protein
VLTLKLKNVELERTVAQMNSEKEIAALRAENAELTKWKKRVLGQQRVQQEQQQQGSSSSNNNYKSAAAPIKREVHGSNQNQQQQQREQRGVNDVVIFTKFNFNFFGYGRWPWWRKKEPV